MSIALLCSGQGRQSRDMLAMFSGCASVEPILAKASALLGEDIQSFLALASEQQLFGNRVSQILCVTEALAAYAALFPDGAPADSFVAGYSVGEMAAWSIAGVWSPIDVLDLVDQRARHMDRASGGEDGLGYVRGLAREAVDSLAARFGCEIAIVNPDRLFIVGGRREALAELCAAAASQGGGNAGLIPVHIASHTARLANAVTPIAQAFQAKRAARPRLRLLSAGDQNLVRDPAKGAFALARQVATPIDWEATLGMLAERCVARILELGPGSALADMARFMMPEIPVHSLDDFRSIAGARAWIEGTPIAQP